jgi:hypothetical protein
MDDETFDDVTGDDKDGLAEAPLPGRRRKQDLVRRTARLTPRLSVSERAEVDAAAASVGMSVNGFAAEAVLKVARGMSVAYGAAQDREALARIQRELLAARTAVNRFGGNVNQAVAAFHATGYPPIEALEHATRLCTQAVQHLDGLIDRVHRRLR